MTHATVEARRLGWTFYYGWVVLGVAALAMVGTLPGRTQGLGLITEPLLRDLAVDRVRFAQINLVATLVGSLFCFGIGGLVDRHGSRVVLAALALLLGGVVLAMSGVHSAAMLLVLITLTLAVPRPTPHSQPRCDRRPSGSSALPARCTASSPRASGCSTSRFSPSAGSRPTSITTRWR